MRLGNPPTTSLTCEFFSGGEFHKGPVVELHLDGFFVQTNAAVERSTMLEIRLENPATGESVTTESIVERRVEPTALAPDQRRGLQLRVFHLTPDYSNLIDSIAPSRAGAARPVSGRLEREAAEHDRAADPETEAGGRAIRSRALGGAASETRSPEPPLLERAGEPVFDEDGAAPQAVVIDDGELSDVVAMLRDLDADPRRSTPSVEGELRDWFAPTRLLVISAKRALSLGYSLDLRSADFTAVVVTESDARTLHPIVHQLGYRFVVRRPVHPEALRTLLRQAMHRDSGRRTSTRVATGCHARWKLVGALRRRDGTVVDLSTDGCRLLVDEAVSLDGCVRIRIPATAASRRRIDVRGRIVRKSTLPGGQRALGILFEEPTQRTRDHLAELVDALASGPARLDDRHADYTSPVEHCEATEVESEPEASEATEAIEAPPERRRTKRASFQRELVALEVGSEAVRLALIGRDLSIGGMRVEPNPELELDDHLRLAFYDNDAGDPLLLHAVVTRIDGRLGTCLRFIGLDDDARSRLGLAIEELPAIESLEDLESEAAWAAIGQLELVPEPLD